MPLFVLAHFSHHLLTALPAPLLPFIRDDFTLDYTRLGFVVSAFALASGFSQLPGGWLADRIGRRLLVTIGVSGVALFGFLAGLSQTYIMLLFFLVLMGIASGGYHPAATPMISASAEPDNRGRALGFHVIGGGGSFFAAPLAAAAIAAAWGWRGPFIVLAVPTMLFGIVFYFLLGRLVEVRGAKPKVDSVETEVPQAPGHLRRLVTVAFMSIFMSVVFFSVTSFIPVFMVDNFGVSREVAAVFLSVVFSSAFWAGPLGGYASDRLGRVPVLLAVCFIAGPIIYLLTVVPYGPFGISIGAVLICLGATQYIRMPVTESYIVSKVSERNRSTVLGIYFFGNMEGAGLLTPVLGYLFDQYGFYTTLTFVSVITVIVTIAGVALLWHGRD